MNRPLLKNEATISIEAPIISFKIDLNCPLLIRSQLKMIEQLLEMDLVLGQWVVELIRVNVLYRQEYFLNMHVTKGIAQKSYPSVQIVQSLRLDHGVLELLSYKIWPQRPA
jgi:hypothetical protein